MNEREEALASLRREQAEDEYWANQLTQDQREELEREIDAEQKRIRREMELGIEPF